MARVNDNPYWTTSGSNDWRTTGVAAAEKHGPSGKYAAAYQYRGGLVHFTGSLLGYGPILVGAAGKVTMSLSDGGEIYSPDLNTGEIIDLSVSRISGSAASCRIYVFKKVVK